MDTMKLYEQVLNKFVERWSSNPDVCAVIVYGSYLTRKMGRYSDLDLIVVKRADYPQESRVYIDGDCLVNMAVIGLGEFTRKLAAGCLSPIRLSLARYKILYDPNGDAEKLLSSAAPCTRYEVDKYALTLLYRFLLQLGRAEKYFELGETLDTMHQLFHCFEKAIMLSLLKAGLPFDNDVFAAGLAVRPDLVATISDVMGHSTYDLALVSQLLERLRDEKDDLLAAHRDRLLEYMPDDEVELSELKAMEVFSETDYILFQTYAERGDLRRVGVVKDVPGFSGVKQHEVGFARRR